MFKKFIIMLVALSIIISLAGCTGGIVTSQQDDDNSIQVEQEFQDNQEMITHHLEEIAEPGKTPEQYAQELAALLMNESQVSKVEVFGNSVNLTYASGKIHTIRFTDKEIGDDDYLYSGGMLSFTPDQKDIVVEGRDTNLSSRSYSPQRKISEITPLEQQTIGIQGFTKGSQTRFTSEKEKIAVNRNILIWDPGSGTGLTIAAELKLIFTATDDLGFDIDLENGLGCTIDSLKQIINYGMVIIVSHGNGLGFNTGEKWTLEKDKKYADDFTIYYDTKIQLVDTFPYFDKRPTVFGVYHDWFLGNIPENNNNTIVINNSCENGNVTWWDKSFKGRAGDYFGWDADVGIVCVLGATGSLMVGLKSGANTQEAYSPYTASISGANFLRFGDPVRFPASNNPPIISSLSANPSDINVNQTTTITCTASDEDEGDTLTYSWSKTGGYFEGDVSGSSVTWRAPSTEGNYTITCEVSDGELSDTEEVIVSVGDVNHPPKITSTAVTSATKLEPYSYDVNATDSDGDTLVYSLTTEPSGMNINSSTGLITWTPTTSGDYNVTVKVSDGELFDTQSFTITVSESPPPTKTLTSLMVSPDTMSFSAAGQTKYLSEITLGWLWSDGTTTTSSLALGDATYSGYNTSVAKVVMVIPNVKVESVGTGTTNIKVSYTRDGITKYDYIAVSVGGLTYTITASAGSHGSISPSGSITVSQGSDKSFTITPDTGYQIDDVLVDGSSVGAVSSYTFTNVTQDHTIYTTFIIEENGTYDLRDTGPAGGYIFYDKGSYSDGWRYLEAAPASTESKKEWGSSYPETFIGGTETGIGTGQSNTTKIVTWLNSHSETDCAAQVCDALVYGGYSDWFLPSKDELNLMRNNLYVFGVGGFTAAYYWSSSEYNAYSVWEQGFWAGDQITWGKYDPHLFRAVRAF